MKRALKYLYTSSMLFLPTVFGAETLLEPVATFELHNSSARFFSCVSFESYGIFAATPACLSPEDMALFVQQFFNPSETTAIETQQKDFDRLALSFQPHNQVNSAQPAVTDSEFQKLLARHIGTLAFKSTYPKILELLKQKILELFYGTGHVVYYQGTKIPVVQNVSFDSILEVVLKGIFPSNSSIGNAIDAASRITGFKPKIEAFLKSKLGIETLESFLERQAQILTLHLIGNEGNSSPSSTPTALTLQQISDLEEISAYQVDRGLYLSEMTEAPTLEYLQGLMLYHFKHIINRIAAEVINNHIENQKEALVTTISSALKTAAVAGAATSVVLNPAFVIIAPALTIATLAHTHGAFAARVGVDAVDYYVIQGMFGLRNIITLPITPSEIQRFNTSIVRLSTETSDDDWVLITVDMENKTASILRGSAYQASSALLTTATNVVYTGSAWLGNFFISTAGVAKRIMGLDRTQKTDA